MHGDDPSPTRASWSMGQRRRTGPRCHWAACAPWGSFRQLRGLTLQRSLCRSRPRWGAWTLPRSADDARDLGNRFRTRYRNRLGIPRRRFPRGWLPGKAALALSQRRHSNAPTIVSLATTGLPAYCWCCCNHASHRVLCAGGGCACVRRSHGCRSGRHPDTEHANHANRCVPQLLSRRSPCLLHPVVRLVRHHSLCLCAA